MNFDPIGTFVAQTRAGPRDVQYFDSFEWNGEIFVIHHSLLETGETDLWSVSHKDSGYKIALSGETPEKAKAQALRVLEHVGEEKFRTRFQTIKKRRCRICGCTDDDCRQCFEKTGKPCYWIEPDLCSACAEAEA